MCLISVITAHYRVIAILGVALAGATLGGLVARVITLRRRLKHSLGDRRKP